MNGILEDQYVSSASDPFGNFDNSSFWHLCIHSISIMLVVATSGTGFVLGSSIAVDFPALCWTCMDTKMVAASANSLNQPS
ncbi:hypothetical protein K1719_016369 [Acacia pycnantha]|nr:hypothetical protein K1719_016369 [Acacia pycnantha]